jgi:S-adenosylmethionine:tRNA ribosyltransferase-isomerase
MDATASIQIEDYDYALPEERIAKYPLAARDQSKLLYFIKGKLSERSFRDLPALLPENSLLVFNETRVIRARLLFRKETGALIEIFCLEPVEPSNDFQLAFQEKSPVVWKCLVGNAKRWKQGSLDMKIGDGERVASLKAEIVEKLSDSYLIRFTWHPEELVFSEIIEKSGQVPLPPYLNREAEESDKNRYQTVYARFDGSVAAPTAGLHFTQKQFDHIAARGIQTEKVTLHVGAGTFRPVISSTIADHEMHAEKIVVALETLRTLLKKMDAPIIPVGTTSMRTLESLYWLALRISQGDTGRVVEQWDPYREKPDPAFTTKKALEVLITFLKENGLAEIHAETRLMIAPGYEFKFCTGIVTNFHQPKSTLLLLVSALIGPDWKKAYQFALDHNFRFLSYGDSCLFLP